MSKESMRRLVFEGGGDGGMGRCYVYLERVLDFANGDKGQEIGGVLAQCDHLSGTLRYLVVPVTSIWKIVKAGNNREISTPLLKMEDEGR